MAAFFHHSTRSVMIGVAVRLVAGLFLLALLVAVQSLPVGAQSREDFYDGAVLTVAPDQHTGLIRQIAVDADERFAVMAADDKTVRIWSVATGKHESSILVSAGADGFGRLYAVAISPDGTLIAAGGRTAGKKIQQHVYLFDRSSGRIVKRLGSLPTSTLHLLFSPDGKHLAVIFGGETGMRVYGRDAEWGEVKRVPAGTGKADILTAAFSRDGRLAMAGSDGTIRLYDRAFAHVADQETRGGREPSSVAFSPDGAKLVIGFMDSAVLEVRDGHSLVSLTGPDTSGITGGSLPKAAWSADGRTILASGRFQRDGRNAAGLLAWSGKELSERQTVLAGEYDLKALFPLNDGGILIADSDGYLARVGMDGSVRWDYRSRKADFRGQQGILAVSHDGMTVTFGFKADGQERVRFHMAGLTWLPPDDAAAASERNLAGNDPMPAQALAAARRSFSRFERDDHLTVKAWEHGFVVGTEWALRRLDTAGKLVWKQAAPGPVLAVTVSGDERMAVAAYGDGSIRWHRMDNGAELLAFMPLGERSVWMAWTPQGFYAASAEGRKLVQRRVTRVREMVAEGAPVADFPNLYQPDAIKLVLQEGETPRALGLAMMKAAHDAIRQRSGMARDANLHVLTVGIDEYGEKAQGLSLHFAAHDARSVGNALENEQGKPYQSVLSYSLTNQMADRRNILDALYLLGERMSRGVDREVAVLMFSAHGAMRGNTYYLLPYGVDIFSRSAFSGTGLSLPELQTELKVLGKKGRVLVLLDTCHSGAVGEAPDANDLSARLADTNITVITSSASGEKSYENERWGHGVFTFALLEAFGRKADTNRNGMISVSELIAHLKSRVGDLTNGAQTVGIKMMYEGDLFAAGL